MRRPSGTSETPERVTASGERPRSDSPGEPDLAAARLDQAHDRVQRRRLSRAVGADQADDLALADLDRHVAHGRDAAVAHVQPRDLEHGRAHPSPCSRTALSPR